MTQPHVWKPGAKLLLWVALPLAGCGKPTSPPASSASLTAPDKHFLAEHRAWREHRLQDLRQPDGWTSLVGLHWLLLKTHSVGSSALNSIRLVVGPPMLGTVVTEGGTVWFIPKPGAAVTADGKPVTGRLRLHSDHDPKPTTIGFDNGKGVIKLIQRGDRCALRVKHADAPARRQFTGVEEWPADPSWRITARYLPHRPGKTLPVVDIVGIMSEQPNPGTLVFERDGRRYRLEVMGEIGQPLFVVFADRTNGHGSYSAGRFLDLGMPDAHSNIVVDFNRAYNPPCAFTPFATCPLPPPENRLDLAVTAGEKSYRKPY